MCSFKPLQIFRVDSQKIFANIEEIYELHKQILQLLGKANLSKTIVANISEIFNTMVD